MPGALFKPGRLLACAAFLSLALLLTSCNAVFCFSTGPTIATVTPGPVLVGGTQVRLTIVGSNFDDGAFAVLSDGTADLGAIAAEFLLLGIDPYPRKPGAEFAQPAQEGAATTPFAALAKLKDAKN